MIKRIVLIALIATTSFNLLSAQITSSAPYCDASFDDMQGFLVDDHINAVSFGTLNNVSNSQFAAPHYVFFNNLGAVNFTRGNSYTLTVNFSTAGGCGYGVWIDFNHNNTFEASEKIAGTTGTTMLAVGTTTTITQSVSIPSTAILGTTRMRVRIVEDDTYNMTTTSELPCNASTSATDVMDWGETEDYAITVTAPLGINELSEIDSFFIYPNPVVTTLTLNENFYNNLTYKIFNHTGQELQAGSLTNSDKQIVVSTLAEGMYILQLFDNTIYLGQRKFTKTIK